MAGFFVKKNVWVAIFPLLLAGCLVSDGDGSLSHLLADTGAEEHALEQTSGEGAGVVSGWALINGERETGVTIMLLDEGEDTGDIISQKAVGILADETSITLHNRLANLAPGLLIKAIKQCETEGGKPFHYPQDNRKSSQAPKLTKSTGIIDWNDNAEQIYNLVRGTFGWPGAKTQLAGFQVKIINCTVLGLQLISGQIKVIRDPNEGLSLVVGTSLGSLKLNTIQPATKGPMSAIDFINGYGIKSGDYAQ